jgi:hypothetical protein
MKRVKLFLFVFVFVFVSATSRVEAATRNVACSGTITSAVQSAINSSVDGDIVSIGAGTCSFGGASWTDKNITVTGAGKGATILNASSGWAVTNKTPGKASWRISSMTMQSSSSASYAIAIYGADASSYTSGWRIDNIKFNYTGDTPSGGMVIYGVTYGLFDHCDLSFAHSVWIYVEMAQYTSRATNDPLYEQCWGAPTKNQVCGRYMLSLPDSLGTANAIYFEDCTFTSQKPVQAFFDTSYGGARMVWRYCTLTGGFLYHHGTRSGELDHFQVELYNNNFIGNSNWNDYPVRFEGGTGVIYNNQLTSAMTPFYLDYPRSYYSYWIGSPLNQCNGGQAWDGNVESNGWPCLTQPGRGAGVTWAHQQSSPKAASVPYYAWRNGTQSGCRTGGACTDSITLAVWSEATSWIKTTAHTNGDKDFCNGGASMPATCGNHRNTYAAYTYPHPLTNGGGDASLAPPANLRITP